MTRSAALARRRLLFVLPFPARLDGTHGGSRVMAQLIHALGARHDIAVSYLRERDDLPIDDRLRERVVRVDEVRVPTHASLGTRIARRTAAVRGIPAWASFANVPELARRVRELAATWRPDIVHFEYHVMGQYVNAVRDIGARCILTEYEVGVLAAREHLAPASRGRGAFVAALQRRAWARFERRVVASMHAVVVFSERDRSALKPLAGAVPIVRIGIGTQLPRVALDPLGAADPPQLVFVGNFRHPPNVDAAVRLAERVFPAVRRHVPAAVLRIVGAAPPAELRALAGGAVEVTGPVPDVTPWLDAASLVVVPLRLGGGMRVKVLEALAHGKAVVASARALEGVAIVDGVHVAIAETDDEFVARIAELIASPEARAAMATAAREWACAHLGEAAWVRQYDALYDRLLAPGGYGA